MENNMTELQELVELDKELDTRSTKLFKDVWQPKFKATKSKEEFRKVSNELAEAAGYPPSLPGVMEVEVMFEADALRNRLGYYKKMVK